MNTTQAQQKALDDAFVTPADHFEFGKCNMGLKTDIKPNEATFQVVVDALALTPFYRVFLITADVLPFICKNFRLQFPFIKFEELPLEHDILSFIKDLGHSRDIIYLTDVSVDYLHQPWRASATIINKCLSGKETGMDKIRLSQNKEAKKTNKISYHRFIKIIIDYFMSKDQSISRINKMFWYIARDDTMFTSMRCFYKHEDTQVYGTIHPKELTNQAMLESNAYKTYYAFASEEKAPKLKIKSKAKVAKSDKKKQPAKKPKAKGFTVLFEVALTEADQLKLATKRSKTEFHSYHASGSGDEVDTQSKVLGEQHLEIAGADEGTDNENDSDDLSDESDDDNDGNNGNDGDDDDANDDDKQEGDDTNDDDEETDKEEENVDDEEKMDEEEDDEVTKELYKDVNVNLGNKDVDLTDADQGGADQQNVSLQSGFEQVEEDAHVTLTPVLDTQKSGGPTQRSFISSDFTIKLLNLDNPSLADNEIASLMDTTAHHAIAIPDITSNFASVFKFNERVINLEKDLSEIKQVDQYAQALSSIPAIVDCYMDNKHGEAINKAIQEHNFDCREEAQVEKMEYIELVDSTPLISCSLPSTNEVLWDCQHGKYPCECGVWDGDGFGVRGIVNEGEKVTGEGEQGFGGKFGLKLYMV
ncbi:hypothetical protein Tco_1524321 [Tanacetum coccineum]